MKKIYFRELFRFLIDRMSFNVKYNFEDVRIVIDDHKSVILNCCREEYLGEMESFLCINILYTEVDTSKIEPFLASQQIEVTVSSYLKTLMAHLENSVNDVLKTFRWLTNQPFDINKKGKYHPIFWSTDNQNWKEVIYSDLDAFEVRGDYGDDAIQLIDEKLIRSLIEPNLQQREPLAHDLIIESKRLLENDDLRGAFLTGFVALEIGVKNFITTKRPETYYLLTEMNSPDIYKLCVKYLPTIDATLKIDSPTLPNGKVKAYETLRIYMNSRNKLVHQGKFNQTFQSVQKQLFVVEFFLHIMDFSNGFDNSSKFAERIRERIKTNEGDDIISQNDPNKKK